MIGWLLIIILIFFFIQIWQGGPLRSMELPLLISGINDNSQIFLYCYNIGYNVSRKTQLFVFIDNYLLMAQYAALLLAIYLLDKRGDYKNYYIVFTAAFACLMVIHAGVIPASFYWGANIVNLIVSKQTEDLYSATRLYLLS